MHSSADIMLQCGDDAAKWAKQFCKTAATLGHTGIDEGWMTAWFASAIEHSNDVRRWRREQQESREQPRRLFGDLNRD